MPLWGWASDVLTPVDIVLVASNGSAAERYRVSADASSGLWTATLRPRRASIEAFELELSNGRVARERLVDIVFGELWLCSGQSNMVFSLAFAFNAARELAAAADARAPLLRVGQRCYAAGTDRQRVADSLEPHDAAVDHVSTHEHVVRHLGCLLHVCSSTRRAVAGRRHQQQLGRHYHSGADVTRRHRRLSAANFCTAQTTLPRGNGTRQSIRPTTIRRCGTA